MPSEVVDLSLGEVYLRENGRPEPGFEGIQKSRQN